MTVEILAMAGAISMILGGIGSAVSIIVAGLSEWSGKMDVLRGACTAGSYSSALLIVGILAIAPKALGI